MNKQKTNKEEFVLPLLCILTPTENENNRRLHFKSKA